MKPLESKLPTVGTTIFTVMTQLANEHRAVNLSQGFPNFEPPAGLIERVEHYLTARCHQYAPMPGSVALRAAIAGKLEDSLRRDARSRTPTSRSRAARPRRSSTRSRPSCAAATRSIVLDPCYDSYEPSVTLAGGRAVHVAAAAAEVRDRLGPPRGRA